MLSDYRQRARDAWDREYREIRAYTTSWRADLDRGVHLLLEYARARGERLATPLVDLGCGMGRNLLPLAAAGHPVIGLDHSAAALERLREEARQRGVHEPRLVQHDLGEPLPLDDGAAGTVLDVTAVDNLVDADRLARYGAEVGRVLRPRGLALVVTFAVGDGYYGPWLAASPWRADGVVEDPHTGIRNRLFTAGALDAVFAPALNREVATTLVFVDDAAGVEWTRRFLVHVYRRAS